MNNRWVALLISIAALTAGPSSTFAQKLPALAETKAAAEKGDPVAQDKLAAAYNRSFDRHNAEIWYRRAAQQGIPNSQHQLGILLLERADNRQAKLSPKERSKLAQEALRFHIMAANQGFRPAQNALGRLYQSGKHLPQDDVEAYKWFALAAVPEIGIVPAHLEGQWARDALILKMTQEQIAEGEKRDAVFVPRRFTEAELIQETPKIGLSDLKLNGIVTSRGRRLALISGQTFAPGEEGTVRIEDQTIRIRCIEISENSVLVALPGTALQIELHLLRSE
jgi:hypothetical protein